MSTADQAESPMDGQDEMNNIFVESYSNNIKRTFAVYHIMVVWR